MGVKRELKEESKEAEVSMPGFGVQQVIHGELFSLIAQQEEERW